MLDKMTLTPSLRVGGVRATLSEIQILYSSPPLPNWADSPSASPFGDADGEPVGDHLVAANPRFQFPTPVDSNSLTNLVIFYYNNLYFTNHFSYSRVRPFLSRVAVARPSSPSSPSSLATWSARRASTPLLTKKENCKRINKPSVTTALAIKWLNIYRDTIIFIVTHSISSCIYMSCRQFQYHSVYIYVTMYHDKPSVRTEYKYQNSRCTKRSRVQLSRFFLSLSVDYVGSLVHSDMVMTQSRPLNFTRLSVLEWRCLRHRQWASNTLAQPSRMVPRVKLSTLRRRAG